MKNTNLIIKLFSTAAIAGLLTYVAAKYTVRYYLQLLPVLLFALIVIFFFRKGLRRQVVKPIAGFTLLSLCFLLLLSVLFFSMLAFPLPGMMSSIRPSEIFLRLFAITGISFFCGFILRVLIYKTDSNHIEVTT